ncbi:MAG: SpoVA/SpoVAEb family sporulation membrane protein [Eubacteriales bacterium]|nr:SpoVA/SpoVAEb family sporulation membrane protein [Eubacteriales bacterium]MDY4899017.1 SpoVA/SpoVAEb family sporulation membrane protein [Eubacteriales bacterium]
MNISKANYPRYADARAPKSALVRDCLRAFVCGGIICAIGEGLNKLYVYAGLERDMAGLLCSVTLVFAAVLLTGLGVFDRIARFAGAGTLVPITGFANAVVSPAMDSYREGLVLGIGAKIFTVAGPVLLYGTLAGAVYGIIYYIVGLF